MNYEEIKTWFEGVKKLQERGYDWAGVPYNENYYVAEAVLKLLEDYENTKKALEDLAETNYNLAHQPTNAFGKVILERDALKVENERLKTLLKEATEDAGYELDECGNKIF